MKEKPYEFELLDALNAIEDQCLARRAGRPVTILHDKHQEEIDALAVLVEGLAKRMADR